ncbi:hypothetical protein [Neisseria sp. Ec49-e6-T10]|uniref:hypothetical protein n=1 Tax=Neisseria sp. Ec49-e6-T10 TaxID=3140744 RepID=UPI003EB7746D
MTNLTLPVPSQRSRIWAYIRTQKGKVFYRTDILSALGLTQNEVDAKYLRCLVNCGFLEVVNKKPVSYKFVKDIGVDTPRFTKAGELITKSTISEVLWLTMRILGRFTTHALVLHASTEDRAIKSSNARVYVWMLKSAGYLKSVGFQGRKEVFLLIKNTGPKPPQILLIKEVYDPNLNKIMLREVPESD